MEPAPHPEHNHQHAQQNPTEAPAAIPAPSAATHPQRTGFLSRTSGAFVAEYCVFLIALGIALSNLISLTYVFFVLVVTSMHGLAAGPSQFYSAWLIVSSVVALPTAFVLWRRVQGELATNETFKGEPHGAAKGFRTFWIIVSALGMVFMLIAGLYVPVSALLTGTGFSEALIGVTLPSLLSIGIVASGIYIATRRPGQTKVADIILWVIAGLTVLLFSINFVWAQNARGSDSPSRYRDTYYDNYYEY